MHDSVNRYPDLGKGITGVSTKKREGFNRIIQNALTGRIDLIECDIHENVAKYLILRRRWMK